MPDDEKQQGFDIRIYIGILFFRWHLIAVCFLYALLAAVLYLNLAPKQYHTEVKLLIYRDPKLQLTADRTPWGAMSSHSYLLRSEKLRRGVARRLMDRWGETIGSMHRMLLPVTVRGERGFGSMLNVSVQSSNPGYNEAFLSRLIEDHQQEWHAIQMESSTSAAKLLEAELARLEERIRAAEDDLIEYQRLHDIARVEARGSMESRYLSALMQRRSMLTTELLLLEAQYPQLKSAGAGTILDVERLTRESGAVQPDAGDDSGSGDRDRGRAEEDSLRALMPSAPDDSADEEIPVLSDGLRDLRVQLAQLQLREQELAENLTEQHPQRRALRSQISSIENQLRVSAEVALARLNERHEAIKTHLEALEAAEYKWQARNLLASKRQAELNRIRAVVSRFEQNYSTLYGRLHDMRVAEELKAEHFRIVEPVSTKGRPVKPDPVKILLFALVMGLGSGFGLALLVQILDNKVQSIADVEEELGVPFLGGVPYWAHSGLEKVVRPIVTEEHSAGAVEAYRALRTNLLTALKKIDEKIVLVTSADSREGKTLTTLNLAILIAGMGKKVLLVDMDLRRGRLHRSLGLDKRPGFTDVLTGQRTLREVVRQTRIEHLSLVSAGETVDNISELLQAHDLRSILAEVADDYDYILIDTSPVLRVSDTCIVANQHVGVVVYITRINHTPKPMVRYSLDMLEDARVLGLIVNSIEMHKISSLYYSYLYPNYGYYSNAYAYGYSYYDGYGDEQGAAGRRRSRRRRTLTRRWQSLVHWAQRTFLPME